MNTITLTGANGFVGVNLFDNLKDILIKPLSIRYIPNQKIIIKTDAIVHLAGIAHDIKKVANPQKYYEANYELTKQLFDAFLLSEATVFIFMSSIKAVADETIGFVTEAQIPNPKTHYGKSKLFAENYILSQGIPKGKRVFILRPCMIHGPGNKGNLNLLYQIVANNFPWPLGAFENQRSFCSIKNVCFIINEILENEGIPSGIYNLADNEAISTNRLIYLMANAKNKKSRVLKIPKGLISVIAKTGDVLKLPFNSERLKKLTQSYVVSNEKIVKAIGKPLPYSAEEGLLKTFHSFKFNKQ